MFILSSISPFSPFNNLLHLLKQFQDLHFFSVKKKHGYSSKLTWLHTVYDWKSTNHNSFQKTAFQTLIFKTLKTDHQVLQKQQLNGATHSQFSETLGQNIETEKPTPHKHLAWFIPRHMIWFTNFKSKSKISSWKDPWKDPLQEELPSRSCVCSIFLVENTIERSII